MPLLTLLNLWFTSRLCTAFSVQYVKHIQVDSHLLYWNMLSNMKLSIYNNDGSPHLSALVHLEEESLGVCLSSLPTKQKRGCLMIWHQGCFPGNNVPGLMCHFTVVARGQHWTKADEGPAKQQQTINPLYLHNNAHTNTQSIKQREIICFLCIPLGRNTKSSSMESVSAVSRLQEKKNSHMSTCVRFLCLRLAQTTRSTHSINPEVHTLYRLHLNKEEYAFHLRQLTS